MRRLGSIVIAQPQSILEARNKIRVVVESLAGDPVLAARLATATSEMARALLRETTEARIEVDLDGQGRRCGLVLTFFATEWTPRLDLLSKFFDVAAPVSRPSGAGRVAHDKWCRSAT